MARLQQITDPDTGEAVIEQVWRREEVYDGAFAERAPDLVFQTREMKYKAMGLSDFSSPRVFDSMYGTTGHHRMNGTMIWWGPGIVREGAEYAGAGIQDLAPTILWLLGQPVPREMDGCVLTEVFRAEFVHERAVIYADAGEAAHVDTSAYSEEEQAEMREMLRGLGYVT